MKISYLREIFESVYMIEPSQAVAGKTLLNGILMGLEFEREEVEQNKSVGHDDFPSIPVAEKINVTRLTGVMYRQDGDCGRKGTQTIANELIEADAEENVIGHILVIDSGGGAANSVPILAKAIRQCSKPIVAFVDGMMASAAMFAGSYCSRIIANDKLDRIGCIGTMVQLADYPKNHKDSDGFVSLRIYADGSEEKNGEYEAALEGDFRLIKEQMLNPLNEDFKTNIKTNRPNAQEEQLKGRTYYAKDCVGTLIDAIGGFDEAVKQVIELSNLNIKQMELNQIQKIDSCRDITSVNGIVSLTEQQVTDINSALAQAEETETLRQQATADKQTIHARDARIAELEAALTAASSKPDTQEQNHNGGTADEHKESSQQEADEYCRKVCAGEI